ncbi:MAG: collagen-like protein [Ilumatobacteraceae bacterium]
MSTEIVRESALVVRVEPIPVVVEQVVDGKVVVQQAGTVTPIVEQKQVVAVTGGAKGDPGVAGAQGIQGVPGAQGATGPAGPANLVVSQANPNLTQNGLWVELNADNTLKTMWVVTV